MAVITGARGTGNVTQGIRKPDIGDQVLLLQPDASPLTVLSKRLRKKATINPQYQWAEDDLDVRFSAVPGGATNVATTINVTAGTGQYFAQHDLVKVTRTSEVFRVTAVATDALTVVRGVGDGGTGQTINAADEILLLGSAQPEGDTSKPARSNTVNLKSNYTQIFRRPWQLTETWRHSDTFFTQTDFDYQRGKYGIEHLKDIEEAFLYGKASEDTSGSQPRRTTGGAISYISTNVTAAGGTLSETSFWTALRGSLRYGSREKWLFTSGLVTSVLQGYPRGKYQETNTNQDTYGLNVTKFQSPFGTLNVINHWLLEGATYGGYALILDPQQLAYRYLANSQGSRDTHVKDNIQAPDEDTTKSEWMTEAGLQVSNEKSHALVTGITG